MHGNGFDVAPLIVSAACYLVFNALMFSGISAQGLFGPRRRFSAAATYLVNYLFFIALSMLEFNLVTNWLIIFVLFALEVKAAYRCRWGDAAFCALLVAVIGLGANMLTRSLCAIAYDVPQIAFSNNMSDPGNLKGVPVALGFLLGGLIMYVQSRRFRHGELAAVLANARSRRLVLVMAGLGYLYLCSVLLLYYVDANDLIVKLWALKAVTSMFVSTSLAFYYAYRTALLIRRGEERRALAREVAEREREGDELQGIAWFDELTGCATRTRFEQLLGERLAAGGSLTLAFVDVNDLKGVNDRAGHESGDLYLAAVAAALDEVVRSEGDFVGRYGGDEFVAVLPEAGEADVAARLEEARHRLRTASRTERYPFDLSVSYGLAAARPGDDVASLVARADAAMYRDKRAAGKGSQGDAARS